MITKSDKVVATSTQQESITNQVAAKAAVEIARGSNTKLESSGGLKLENAAAYAATGVDYLAVGALTHSAPVLDIGLDF